MPASTVGADLLLEGQQGGAGRKWLVVGTVDKLEGAGDNLLRAFPFLFCWTRAIP